MIEKIPSEITDEVKNWTSIASEIAKKNAEIHQLSAKLAELNSVLASKGFVMRENEDMSW